MHLAKNGRGGAYRIDLLQDAVGEPHAPFDAGFRHGVAAESTKNAAILIAHCAYNTGATAKFDLGFRGKTAAFNSLREMQPLDDFGGTKGIAKTIGRDIDLATLAHFDRGPGIRAVAVGVQGLFTGLGVPRRATGTD